MPIDPAAALAAPGGEVRVPGVERPVTILRDRWGIPHVRAETLADVFFGQGYACAADRLWQVEHDRLRARGNLASVLGERAVAWDAFARRCGLARAARAGYDALDAATRAMLDAHAAGMNAWCAAGDARPVELQALDHEPAPFEPWDAIGVFLARHVLFATWDLKVFRARAAAEFGPEVLAALRQEGAVGAEVPLILPPGARAAITGLPYADVELVLGALAGIPLLAAPGGSNAWVLHGSRTGTGGPLLAGDPHRLLEVPNVYAQVHLAGGGVDAAGFAFPGVPGVPHFAQTPDVAWGVTNAGADYQDLFVERFRRHDGELEYEFRGTWRPAAVSEEEVAVRGGAPVTVEVVETHHGPVVLGDVDTGYAIALRSSGLLEPGGSIGAVLPLLRARTVDDLDAALACWVEPANNFVLADRGGSIAYRTAGRVPVRSAVNAWIPVPGWTGLHEWEGILPDGELPRGRDPDGGAIVTANQRIVGPAYRHLLGVDYADGHRARRIEARLGEAAHASVDDCEAVHRDTVSLAALDLCARIAALAPAAWDDDAAALARVLAAWDGRMDAGAVEPSLYAAVRAALVRRLAREARVAPLLDPMPGLPPGTLPGIVRLGRGIGGMLAAGDTTLLAAGEGWDGLLAAAVQDAATALAGVPAEELRWGRRHRASPLHALGGVDPDLDAAVAVPAVELAGDLDCVFAVGGAPGIADAAFAGSTARYVFDLADRRRSRWVVPLGASGHPASPHFTDQQAAWAEGTLLPAVTDAGELDALARDGAPVVRLVPDG